MHDCHIKLKDVFLYFDNGLYLKAKGFGSDATITGEVVFNTGLCGYQEVITDPSYAGQFIVFCMPEIGIVGFNDKDYESRSVFAKGVFMRKANGFYSNFRANENIESFFKKHNLLGICNIDTRNLTKMIRDNGSLNVIASTIISNKDELAKLLKESPTIENINYVAEVSTNNIYKHDKSIFDFSTFDYENGKCNNTKHIIAIDFGIKRNILNELHNAGLSVEVVPYNFKANDLIARFKNKEIGGVFLSNGPGNPEILQDVIEEIKLLIQAKIPMFGICLGHQLLSIAHNHNIYKLKFGQHGCNHPVKNLINSEIEITSQNHIYNVPESISEVATITHRNLFDNTIEGVIYKDSPIISLQYHPEASPGPKEASKIFKEFANMVIETNVL